MRIETKLSNQFEMNGINVVARKFPSWKICWNSISAMEVGAHCFRAPEQGNDGCGTRVESWIVHKGSRRKLLISSRRAQVMSIILKDVHVHAYSSDYVIRPLFFTTHIPLRTKGSSVSPWERTWTKYTQRLAVNPTMGFMWARNDLLNFLCRPFDPLKHLIY